MLGFEMLSGTAKCLNVFIDYCVVCVCLIGYQQLALDVVPVRYFTVRAVAVGRLS